MRNRFKSRVARLLAQALCLIIAAVPFTYVPDVFAAQTPATNGQTLLPAWKAAMHAAANAKSANLLREKEQLEGDIATIDRQQTQFDDGAAKLEPSAAYSVEMLQRREADTARLSQVQFDLAQLQCFQGDIDAYASLAESGSLNPDDVIGTYSRVYHMLQPNRTAKVDERQRMLDAVQVMHNAVDPTRINQGKHNTCAPTSLEKRVYIRVASAAAAIVDDLDATGAHRFADGTVIRLDAPGDPSLTPGAEEKNFDCGQSVRDDSRNDASQKFQVAVVNLWLKEHGRPERYEQRQPQFPGDTGAYLVNLKTGHSHETTPLDFATALRDADEMYYLVTGKQETGFSIISAKYKAKGAIRVNIPADLNKVLMEMEKAGLMPACIEINTKNEPFLSDAPNTVDGPHELIVVRYDWQTGYAYVSNHWGDACNHMGRPGGKGPIYYVDLCNAIIDKAHNK